MVAAIEDACKMLPLLLIDVPLTHPLDNDLGS